MRIILHVSYVLGYIKENLLRKAFKQDGVFTTVQYSNKEIQW